MSDSKWKCPKCGVGASPESCPDPEKCEDGAEHCQGLICQCVDEGSEGHGESFADICTEAYCYHCGWGGQLPPRPKKMLPWEKKALEAGWKPPKGWGT